MGWELRNGRRYYYRKIRRGKRVISEYVGMGAFAEILSQLDDIDRAREIAANVAWRNEKNLDKKLNHEICQLTEIINGMARASLLVSGYHSHKGQWRQIRNG